MVNGKVKKPRYTKSGNILYAVGWGHDKIGLITELRNSGHLQVTNRTKVLHLSPAQCYCIYRVQTVWRMGA